MYHTVHTSGEKVRMRGEYKRGIKSSLPLGERVRVRGNKLIKPE
jgi:hypothetical protein